VVVKIQGGLPCFDIPIRALREKGRRDIDAVEPGRTGQGLMGKLNAVRRGFTEAIEEGVIRVAKGEEQGMESSHFLKI
jgi:hypothetical protein